MNPTVKQQNLALAGELSPAAVWDHFAELSCIPRGSGNEGAVADYLQAFADARSLFCHRDAANNILIRRPASPDAADAPTLLLQGHTDMVCEKNSDTAHDFLTDPIRLQRDGDWVTADGTTLGGDDGIAVAMMLALLDGAAPRCPALECLFTTAEETGMDGAIAFDYTLLTARRMINLDSEDERQITAGCAGGVRTDLSLPVHRRALCTEREEYLRVSLRGLGGGHSGEDINKGRANANVLMARLLSALRSDVPFALVRLFGGSKDNAIPRECEATVCVSSGSAATVAIRIMQLADEIEGELCAEDRNCTVSCERAEAEEYALAPMDADSTARVIAALNTVPCGVLRMSLDVPGLVEYSRNVGVLRTTEATVEVTLTSRSCRESLLDHTERAMSDFACLCGGTATNRNRYPGWEFAPDSAIRDAYIDAYRARYGATPAIAAIHAGLECGYIKKRLPDMDIISVGPDMRDIHSPDERLSIPSVARVWQTLLDLLAAYR